MSLLQRTARGALWSAAGSWSQVAIGLIGVAVIARAVGPQSYGLFGVATLVCGVAAMACHGALVEAIVQREDLQDGHVDATFWLATSLSTLAAIGLTAFAAPIAAAFGPADALAAAEVESALRVLAPLLPLSAAGSVMSALLERDLRFPVLVTIRSVAILLANAVGIAAALAGAGVFALVAMEATRVLVSLVGVARAVTWRPGRRGTLAHLRSLRRFNLQVLATMTLGELDHLLPRALIGALLGPLALGHFMLARRVFDELSRLVLGPIAGVSMAAAARAAHDPATLHRLIEGLYRGASVIALPTFVGAIVVAPVLVPLMFGEGWAAAVPALQLLLLCGLRTATGIFNVSILRGLGRADLPLWLLGAGVVLQATLLPALAHWGLVGAVAAIVLRTWATWPLGCAFVRTASGLPVRRQLMAGAPALAAAAAMAAGLAALDDLWAAALSPASRLVADVAAGALLYVAALAVVSPATVRDASALWRAARGRVEAPAAPAGAVSG